MDGITAILKNVVNDYGGDDKYFITGLEAAGHTVWGVLFNHPEAVRAQRSCVLITLADGSMKQKYQTRQTE